jgi:hypothetical protein
MLTEGKMSNRRRWTIGGIVVGLVTLVSGILLTISENIVSNHLDISISANWGAFATFIIHNWFPWIIVGGLALTWGITVLVLVMFWRHRSSILNQALTTANNLLDLDDSLLRLLASWIVSKDHEAEMKRLLSELLRDACAEFDGFVHRSMILLPNDSGEYLKVWSHFGLSDASAVRIRFYVGNDPDSQNLRGVAGHGYLTGKLRTGHMKQEKGVWKCSCPDFIPFVGKHPPYRSFVSVPIFGVNPTSSLSNSICIGVLSFDSMAQSIFEKPEVQLLLRVIARRVGAALLIYQQLQASGTPLQPFTYFKWNI